MSNGTETICPGDRIQTNSGQFPRDPNKGSDYMIVEWVEIKDGVKIIWVRRP